MNSWLAYESNRAYVFQDLVWDPNHFPWPPEKIISIPPHTPLNALISGPTVGGSWDPMDKAPRSISHVWYDTVCPESDRKIITTPEIKPAVANAEGTEVFAAWERVLKDTPERCVEIHHAGDDIFGQTFDLFLWTSPRLLSLWEDYKKSPVSRLLRASPLVQSAVYRNEYLFIPRGPRPPAPASTDPFDRMMALHLRRGDYVTHCEFLANRNESYYGWNQLEFLPDRFEFPAMNTTEEGKTEATTDGLAHYSKHCYPKHEDIMEKARQSRDDFVRAAKEGEYRYLDMLYLATNDHSEWLDNLKSILKQSGWRSILTTRDLELDAEQKEVGMAVDMELARKAAVFVGNGVRIQSHESINSVSHFKPQWSSYSSNIVYRRLVDGREDITNRFF